jgi:hypothetical protein
MKKKLTSFNVKVNDKASDNDMKKTSSKSKPVSPAPVVASVKTTGPVNVGIRSAGNSEPVDVGAC